MKPFVARGEPGAARAALAALATRAAGPTVAVVAGVASFAAGPTVTTPAAFEMGRVAGGTGGAVPAVAAATTIADFPGVTAGASGAPGNIRVERRRPGRAGPAVAEQQSTAAAGSAGHCGRTRASQTRSAGPAGPDQPRISTAAGNGGGRGRRPRPAITEQQATRLARAAVDSGHPRCAIADQVPPDCCLERRIDHRIHHLAQRTGDPGLAQRMCWLHQQCVRFRADHRLHHPHRALPGFGRGGRRLVGTGQHCGRPGRGVPHLPQRGGAGGRRTRVGLRGGVKGPPEPSLQAVQKLLEHHLVLLRVIGEQRSDPHRHLIGASGQQPHRRSRRRPAGSTHR